MLTPEVSVPFLRMSQTRPRTAQRYTDKITILIGNTRGYVDENRRVGPNSPLFLIDGEHCLIKNIKTMKKKTTKSSYESPQVRVGTFSLERGFATSTFGEAGAAGAKGKVVTLDGEDDF